MDGRPEQKLGCVGESEADAQTARGVGAADGAGNTVSGNWGREKRLFILQPLLYLCGILNSTICFLAQRGE